MLVTGGASFIGSHLVDALVERGARVRVVDDLSSGRLENIQQHIDAGRVVPEGVHGFRTETAQRYYHGPEALSDWTLDSSDPQCYRKALQGMVGFGCNMAFRKQFLEAGSPFPEDLGAGSLIGSGDDFYMFVQVLKHGLKIRHRFSAAVTHFFPQEVARQRSRVLELCAGNAAFVLKLLVEEEGVRWPVVRFLFSALEGRSLRLLDRRTLTPGSRVLLSGVQAAWAYFRGPLIYWRSRRRRDTQP